MSKTQNLKVWHQNILVGDIWVDTKGILGFKYDEKWITNGFPISQQLPFDQL